MSDYPRDLVNKDGKVQEFKRREDVPPGWFVRDTGEEVNPQEVPPPADVVEETAPKKKKGKPAPMPVEYPDDPGDE